MGRARYRVYQTLECIYWTRDGIIKENNFFESSIKVFKNTWFQFLIIAGLIASMFIPISLSTVGKSEIVPKDPML